MTAEMEEDYQELRACDDCHRQRLLLCRTCPRTRLTVLVTDDGKLWEWKGFWKCLLTGRSLIDVGKASNDHRKMWHFFWQAVHKMRNNTHITSAVLKVRNVSNDQSSNDEQRRAKVQTIFGEMEKDLKGEGGELPDAIKSDFEAFLSKSKEYPGMKEKYKLFFYDLFQNDRQLWEDCDDMLMLLQKPKQTRKRKCLVGAGGDSEKPKQGAETDPVVSGGANPANSDKAVESNFEELIPDGEGGAATHSERNASARGRPSPAMLKRLRIERRRKQVRSTARVRDLQEEVKQLYDKLRVARVYLNGEKAITARQWATIASLRDALAAREELDASEAADALTSLRHSAPSAPSAPS